MTEYSPPERFEKEIAIVIHVAEWFTDEAAERAAFNLLQYLAGCAVSGSNPRREAVDYLLRVLSKLTPSQRSELGNELCAKRGRPSRGKNDEKEAEWRNRVKEAVSNPMSETIDLIISALPKLTSKQRWNLAKRATSRIGRPSNDGLKQDDTKWWNSMRLGAEVSRLKKEYEEPVGVRPLKGEPGPYEAAIERVAENYELAETLVKECYSKFRDFEKLGIFQDDDPSLMGEETRGNQ